MAKKQKDIMISKTAKLENNRKQIIGLGILCGVTGVLEIICIILLAKLNMLPAGILILIIVAFLLLAAIITMLMFMPSKNKFGKRKIAATILAIITIISCIIGIYFMSGLLGTLDTLGSKKKMTADELNSPYIVCISGSDSRGGSLEDVGRSDVNILAVVNPETHQVLLLNTPRDYYVPNPALKDGMDKLTHCGIYGIENSIKALENLYDISIDYHCIINFNGFVTLVDAVGGVDIYVESPFYTEIGNNYISQGDNHMDGWTALTFVRERHHLPQGDISRGENQMKMIKALAKKVASPAILKSYSELMNSLEGMFETDVPQVLIKNTVKNQLGENTDWNIVSYTVSGDLGMETCASSGEVLSIVYQDEEMIKEAQDKIAAVFDGNVIS